MTTRSLGLIPLALVVALLLGAPAWAGKKPTGTINAQGKVMVNGAQSLNTSTLVSGSQITTKENSTAVLSLGVLGQVFVDANSDLKLEFDDTGVNIELMAGSLRVQKSNNSNIQVLTRTCAQAEVVNGEIMATGKESKTAADGQWVLKAGDLKEWKDKGGITTNSQTAAIDYRVSVISCDLSGAATSARRIPLRPVLAGAAAAGGAGIVTPIIRDNNPVSRSTP